MGKKSRRPSRANRPRRSKRLASRAHGGKESVREQDLLQVSAKLDQVGEPMVRLGWPDGRGVELKLEVAQRLLLGLEAQTRDALALSDGQVPLNLGGDERAVPAHYCQDACRALRATCVAIDEAASVYRRTTLSTLRGDANVVHQRAMQLASQAFREALEPPGPKP